MKPFRWSHEKNETLKQERSISFEEIVLAIESGGLLDELKHPNKDYNEDKNSRVRAKLRKRIELTANE